MSSEVYTADEAEIVERWRDADKLESWGFGAAKYLNTDGTFDEDRYLRDNFQVEKDDDGYHIGELRIPEVLVESDFSRETVGMVIADFGLGHRREEDAYRKMMKVLGIKTRIVDLAELRGRVPLAVRIIAGFQERYLRVSHEEGYLNGTAHKAVEFDDSKVDPLINFVLDMWKKFDYQGYHNSILGKPDETFTEMKVKQRIAMLDMAFGKGLRDHMDSLGVTRNMIFWPMIKKGFVGPTTMFTTDAVVDPRGWRSEYPTVVEMKLAKDRFVDIYDGEAEENVVYFNGFPAQLGGLTKVRELSKIRAEKLNSGEHPLTVVMTASGAATVQKKFFMESMREMAPSVSTGDLRIVIQCGYGGFGRQVNEAVEELAVDLQKEYPGFADGFSSHYSVTPQGAIDYGEMLSSGECPLVFLGKGGEWTRMLLQMGDPHIVPVAIGDQENWNIITACMQDTCISLLPTAYEQVTKFIDTVRGFPEDMKLSAHLAVNRHRVDNLREGLDSTAWAISEQRTVADTNRSAQAEATAMMMTML